MHLLAAQAGALQQDGEAIDLGQTPADIVFASAADSELMMLAAAADRCRATDLRLGRISCALATTCRSICGSSRRCSTRGWWSFACSGARPIGSMASTSSTGLAAAGRFRLALLPGDATPDPILQQRSTVAPEDWSRLHALFTAGGPENADALLQSFQSMVGGQGGCSRAEAFRPLRPLAPRAWHGRRRSPPRRAPTCRCCSIALPSKAPGPRRWKP